MSAQTFTPEPAAEPCMCCGEALTHLPCGTCAAGGALVETQADGWVTLTPLGIVRFSGLLSRRATLFRVTAEGARVAVLATGLGIGLSEVTEGLETYEASLSACLLAFAESLNVELKDWK